MKSRNPRPEPPHGFPYFRRRIRAGLLILAGLCLPSLAHPDVDTADTALLGLILQGRDAGEGLIVRMESDDRIWLPLNDLLPLLGIHMDSRPEGFELTTPLGVTRLHPGEVQHFDNQPYVSHTLFAQRIAALIRFDEAEFALRVWVLWHPGRGPGLTPADPIRPDVTAARASLSRVRGELNHTEFQTRDANTRSFLEAYGRAGPGIWQGRANWDDNAWRGSDYRWSAGLGDFALRFGHQLTGAHPLFDTFHLTGAQAAWSNRADRLLQPEDAGDLIVGGSSPIRSFRGQGPPGGLAELRIDGVVVRSLRIPLDGTYEFTDVPVPPDFADIEVAAFRPFERGVPDRVIDHSGRAATRLVPRNAVVVHAGAGHEGNPLDDRIPARDTAGMALMRIGLTDFVTLEAALQSTDRGTPYALGLLAALGRLGFFSISAAQGDAGRAYLSTLDGRHGPWYWRASQRLREAGFRDTQAIDREDRRLEAGRLFGGNFLDLSVIARQRSGFERDTEYILPAARLRPTRYIRMQSRPDTFGNYVHDAEWRLTRDTRWSVRRDRSSLSTSLDHRWSPMWRSTASVGRRNDDGEMRYDLLQSFSEPNPYGWRIDLGLQQRGDVVGGLIRAGREIRPGLRFRIDGRHDADLGDDSPTQGWRVQTSLAFDLGWTGSGFTRASGARQSFGSVGGRITGVPTGIPLDGVPVRINQQPRGETDREGTFFIGNIRPGVYRIRLDEQGLPMELTPREETRWIEIAAGAVTTVDFPVDLLLGAAGRLYLPPGTHTDGWQIVLQNAKEETLQTLSVNRFGFWRADGLPPGHYWILARDPNGHLHAKQPLALTDRFLLGQNLSITQIPTPTPPLPE